MAECLPEAPTCASPGASATSILFLIRSIVVSFSSLNNGCCLLSGPPSNRGFNLPPIRSATEQCKPCSKPTRKSHAKCPSEKHGPVLPTQTSSRHPPSTALRPWAFNSTFSPFGCTWTERRCASNLATNDSPSFSPSEAYSGRQSTWVAD